MASLRQLIPRASLTLHSRQLQHRLIATTVRHASSTTPPPKPRLLEKPERFNPPSHPSRLRSKQRYTGPPLSEHERKAQKTRKYPHMMPAEGTFMFWFLTNRPLHMWITLVRCRLLLEKDLLTDTIRIEHITQPRSRRLVRRLLLQHTLSRPASTKQHVLRPSIQLHRPILGRL